MTTFSIVVVPAKQLANGKHRIRIAVAHRSQTRYIATPFVLDSMSQFKKGRVVRHEQADRINRSLHRKIDEYTLILSTLGYAERLTCTEIIHYILNVEKKKNLFFYTLADEFLETMRNEEQIKSYSLYKTAFHHFYLCFGKQILVEQLTPIHIQHYREALSKKELSDTTIRIYLTLIRTVINYAIKMNYVHYAVHPFSLCRLPAAHVRELDLSIAELKNIRDLHLENKRQIMVRDIFMLSYYLGGINLKDLLACRFDENQHILKYIRHKTQRTKSGKNVTAFTIQPEARRLIDKYRTPEGFLRFGELTQYNKVYSLVYRHLGKIARKAGITTKVSYYSARKSFAQHGYDAGIQIETIEYCIGHSMKSNRPICNYIRVMQKHADVAMRKIFDRLL